MDFHIEKRKEIDAAANECHEAWLALRSLVFDIMDKKKSMDDAGDELTVFYVNMIKMYWMVKENPAAVSFLLARISLDDN